MSGLLVKESELRSIAEQLVGFSNNDLDKLFRYVEEIQTKIAGKNQEESERRLQEFGTNKEWNINTSSWLYGIFVTQELFSYEELKDKFNNYLSAKQRIDGWRLAKDVFRLLDKVTDEKSFKEISGMTYAKFAEHKLAYPISLANEITNKLMKCNINHQALYDQRDHNNFVRLRVTASHDTNFAFVIKIDYSDRESQNIFKAWLYAIDTTAFMEALYPVLFFCKENK